VEKRSGRRERGRRRRRRKERKENKKKKHTKQEQYTMRKEKNLGRGARQLTLALRKLRQRTT
jgi:hypothetical protein